MIALVHLAARGLGAAPFTFDTTLQTPLMTAFFTTIGLGSSLTLFKTGGPKILSFFIIATFFTLLQNAIGIAVAVPLGQHPLFGVLNSSATLVGGPATGLAFAPLFEKAGVTGAVLPGGRLGHDRHHLRRPHRRAHRHLAHRAVPAARRAGAAVRPRRLPRPSQWSKTSCSSPKRPRRPARTAESYVLLKSIVAILAAMWIGYWISRGFTALGITLPAYIGAMFAGAIIRNLADFTGLHLPVAAIDRRYRHRVPSPSSSPWP